MQSSYPGPLSRPFLRPDSSGFGDMVADMAVLVLEQTGVTGLSSRAIAAQMRVTPSALTQRAGRAELLRVVLLKFGDRWLQWADVPPWHDLPTRLPQSSEEMHGVRVWHALAELARGEALTGNQVLADVIAQTREDERQLVIGRLGHLIGRPPSAAEVATTTALVAGLRLEIVAADPAISPSEAVDVLSAHVRRLAGVSQVESDPTQEARAG